MKTSLTLLLIVITSVCFAQQGINYKALIKDANGNVVANKSIIIQFQILHGKLMLVAYEETHKPTTDANGIVTVNIGEGTTSGVFSTDVDWGSGNHYLNVQIDIGNGLIDIGTTRFMAVPYSKHSETAANAATRIDDLKDGKSDATGSSVFLGLNAGLNDDGTENGNIAVGLEALYFNTTGFQNTANGVNALRDNSTGTNNTGIGAYALYNNTTGVDNTANGAYALQFNTIGSANTANGKFALRNNNQGVSNTAIGYNALYTNRGSFNTANGAMALYKNSTAENNTANGYNALRNTTTGGDNTANGAYALNDNTTGYRNTAFGFYALHSNTTGVGNTVIGWAALNNNTTGWNNTVVGFGAGSNLIDGHGNIFIGNNSGYYERGDDKLYITNTETANPLIYGQFDKNLLTFHGSVGIDTKTPSTKLQIAGGTDASMAGGSGYLVLGDEGSGNIVIDNNEMMARFNGAAASLYLQNDGGDVRVGGSVVHSSDRRLKRDIEILPYGLNEILQLQPKSYYWKNREQDSKSFGLIAQEVEPILKELVSVNDPERQMLGINYNELITVLIKAIQEQQEIIKGLRATNDQQDKNIQSITAELRELGAKKEIISGTPH